jgi:outer membrane lipoprotein carrier protein
MKIILGAVAVAFAMAAGAASLERYKAFLNGTQSARAQFEQKVYDRNGKMTQESRGSFVFQRPGKFRWVYDKPADQVIVGDGQRVWIYDEDLNQVIVRRIGEALGSTPAALLSGSQDVEKAFTWKDLPPSGGLEWLSATPISKETTFAEIRLGFDARGLAALELLDAFGQKSVVRFTTFERNPKLAPSSFTFTPPKGADVIGDK